MCPGAQAAERRDFLKSLASAPGNGDDGDDTAGRANAAGEHGAPAAAVSDTPDALESQIGNAGAIVAFSRFTRRTDATDWWRAQSAAAKLSVVGATDPLLAPDSSTSLRHVYCRKLQNQDRRCFEPCA